tara:strand:- start:286 stop:672 length:387 start_codon:yes stop_codon:yes gene_type:complete
MLNKLFLILTSFTYLYLGGWAAFYPESYVELIGISINDNVGSSEIRSPIGGVNLLIGLFSFYAIFRSKHEDLFFKILLFIISGILVGRFITFIYGEFTSVYLLYFTLFELVYVAFLATAIKRKSRKLF